MSATQQFGGGAVVLPGHRRWSDAGVLVAPVAPPRAGGELRPYAGAAPMAAGPVVGLVGGAFAGDGPARTARNAVPVPGPVPRPPVRLV